MYCDVDLDLDTYLFRDVAEFAMAAEKYQIFSAMAVCRLYMKCVLLLVCLTGRLSPSQRENQITSGQSHGIRREKRA